MQPRASGDSRPIGRRPGSPLLRRSTTRYTSTMIIGGVSLTGWPSDLSGWRWGRGSVAGHGLLPGRCGPVSEPLSRSEPSSQHHGRVVAVDRDEAGVAAVREHHPEALQALCCLRGPEGGGGLTGRGACLRQQHPRHPRLDQQVRQLNREAGEAAGGEDVAVVRGTDSRGELGRQAARAGQPGCFAREQNPPTRRRCGQRRQDTG
ncbi:MAG: hypothetical protein JWO88_3237 [Frankiales bacterium]|nr:hypothetical protein [Frankiales bacterium]